MKWLKRFLAVVALLVLLAATAIYFTPLDTYVPEIERALSAELNEPVKIKHLKFGALPFPHLALENIEIGERDGIALQSVKIIFDIRSLFGAQRVIRHVILKNGSVTQAQLEKLFVLLQSAAAAPPPFRVEELQFTGIRLAAPKFALESLEGKLEFAPDGSLARAWFALDGKKATATLRPQPGNTYAVEAQANAWSPPNHPAIKLTSLNVNGVLAETRFDAKNFSAEIYGARIAGGALLEWKPEWRLALRLDAAEGKLERLLPLLNTRAVMASGDLRGKGSLSARGTTAMALPGNLKIDAEAEIKNATLHVPGSFHQALALDAARTHLSGTLAEITLSGLRGKLYGGSVEGSAVIRSSDASVRADVVFGDIAIGPVAQALSNDVTLSGTLEGKAKFSVKAKEFARFPQNLQLDGEFRIRNGVLRKVDMVQAASNPLKEGNKGGTTSFTELSSLLSVDADGYHFKDVKVSSGAFNAEGQLDVSPQQQLSGLLDTDVKGTATLISMPLAISGSLSDPVLRPTKSALAGASVGTALMGPGLGTALGIKAGNLLNKLFGSRKEKTGEKNESKPGK
ncbi:MAG: AsmA family protein [Nitrosomonadales bacterium]|nr:AsmA family protein [Nitrosomonadales bacterium]